MANSLLSLGIGGGLACMFFVWAATLTLKDLRQPPAWVRWLASSGAAVYGGVFLFMLCGQLLRLFG